MNALHRLVLVSLALLPFAASAEPRAFDAKAFAAAQATDKPILVDIYATW